MLTTPWVGTKQDASHLGGVTDPLIVNWPGHIKPGVRGQFSHVNDIAPTIYDIVGIKFPDEIHGVKQIPLEGKSLTYTVAASALYGFNQPLTLDMTGQICLAALSCGIAPMVRVPANTPDYICRVLDGGAAGRLLQRISALMQEPEKL